MYGPGVHIPQIPSLRSWHEQDNPELGANCPLSRYVTHLLPLFLRLIYISWEENHSSYSTCGNKGKGGQGSFEIHGGMPVMIAFEGTQCSVVEQISHIPLSANIEDTFTGENHRMTEWHICPYPHKHGFDRKAFSEGGHS